MRTPFLLMALALVGCGGKMDTAGTSSGASSGGASGDSGAGPDGGSDDELATTPWPDVAPFTAAEVAAAKARCDLPEGPVEDVTQRIDVEKHVIGAWYHCGGYNYVFGPEGPALQLLPDGTFATLETTADGGLVAKSGYDFTGTWKPYNSAGSSVGEHWYIDFYCGACAGNANGIPVFETSRRRMKGHLWSEGNWLVPLVHGS